MILEEFDKAKTAILNPSHFATKIKDFPKACVGIFDKELIDYVSKNYQPQIIGKISNATRVFNIYKIKYQGRNIAVVHLPVGAPACTANFEDLIEMGCKSMVAIGCCGCLDDKIEDYSIIIPTESFRDEGTSYHYLPASPTIKINKQCVNAVESVIKKTKLPYYKGINWTTDAIYRETKAKTERRKAYGAITVDMENSALTAVAKFRNVKFAQFFYAADNLGGEEYDPRSLQNNDVEPTLKVLPIAFKCAIELSKLVK